jgi:PPOX class probable F420-dependent enzyme
MSRRDAIQLTPAERDEFLATAKTIILSTIDRHGYPHAVAMWFVMEGDDCLMTTYAKSQKAVNVERNPKVSLLVESGVTYDTLRGVLIRGTACLEPGLDRCLDVLTRVHAKMLGSQPAGLQDALRQQARKRVVIRVTPVRVSSWDHSKLGGAY